MEKKPDRLKPLSLYPLLPEQALLAFLRTDPKKVRAAERKMQKKKLSRLKRLLASGIL
jgi:hypothetical protein